jgi:hypothetical protein
MNLEDKREAYKSFFKGMKAGQQLMEAMLAVERDNVKKAQSENSLDYLSRSKGNAEMIALVENVLNTEQGVKE